MKRKKYSHSEAGLRNQAPVVKEGRDGGYARKKSLKVLPVIGISLAEAKKRLSKPVRRSEKDMRAALKIVGIGEGPEDLSQNMRAYLQSE
jgi:hypothetical protein